MNEAIMTVCFFLLAAFGIIIRAVLPITIIIIGLFWIKKNKKSGKKLLGIGIGYLIGSIIMLMLQVFGIGS
jgi:hypothetical protein